MITILSMSASSLRRDSRIEGDAHFLLEADGLLVRWDRHAHLTRDEEPAAGFGIDTQRLAEALRDRAGEMSCCAHDGILSL